MVLRGLIFLNYEDVVMYMYVIFSSLIFSIYDENVKTLFAVQEGVQVDL